jgi:hypothetical protein
MPWTTRSPPPDDIGDGAREHIETPELDLEDLPHLRMEQIPRQSTEGYAQGCDLSVDTLPHGF